jgi:hypothetical protein
MPLRMIPMIMITTPQDRKPSDVHNNIEYKRESTNLKIKTNWEK